MYTLTVEKREYFNQSTQMFFTIGPNKPATLRLEHSLISVFKWEGRWKTPFLSKKEKTKEQWLDYISCMSLDGPIRKEVLEAITNEQFIDILHYISTPQSATKITNRKKAKGPGEILTAEAFYYYIGSFNLPIQCEKWHLSRLIEAIQYGSMKQSAGTKESKMSQREILDENHRINAMRRKKLGTKG